MTTLKVSCPFFKKTRNNLQYLVLLNVAWSFVFSWAQSLHPLHPTQHQPMQSDGTTNAVYGTTNADPGVGIGMLRGDSTNLIEKAIN